MNIQTLLNTLTPHKRVIFISLGLIAVLCLSVFIFQSCHALFEDWEREGDKKAINDMMRNANIEKRDLDNLKLQEAIKETEVNAARNDLLIKQEAVNNARSVTNESVLRTNRIQTANYANTRLKDALNAQCRAFPERCK